MELSCIVHPTMVAGFTDFPLCCDHPPQPQTTMPTKDFTLIVSTVRGLLGVGLTVESD